MHVRPATAFLGEINYVNYKERRQERKSNGIIILSPLYNSCGTASYCKLAIDPSLPLYQRATYTEKNQDD
jgi:hypothetical protein